MEIFTALKGAIVGGNLTVFGVDEDLVISANLVMTAELVVVHTAFYYWWQYHVGRKDRGSGNVSHSPAATVNVPGGL